MRAERSCYPAGLKGSSNRAMTIPRLLLVLIVILNYAYTALFNFIPHARNDLASAIGIGYCLLAIVTLLMAKSDDSLPVWSAFGLSIACWMTSFILSSGSIVRFPPSVDSSVRSATVYLMVIGLMAFPRELPSRVLFCCSVGLIWMATVVAITQPRLILDFSPRLAPFTGLSPDVPLEYAVHPSSYAVLGFTVVLIQLRYRIAVNRTLLLLTVAQSGVLMIGYGVSTVEVAAIVYFCSFWLLQKRPWLYRHLYGVFVVYLIFLYASMWAADFFSNGSLGELGSGRVAVFVGRLNILSSRDLMELLFGSGAGTDHFVTSEWWWMAADSHNDFVNILIERGVLGLLSALLLFKGIARWVGARGTPVVLCIGMTASLSNGLLSRPPLFFLFALALAASPLVPPARACPASGLASTGWPVALLRSWIRM